jgi:adenosylmethionine-8-amino-7-oxononanoate aminotransferase
VRREIADAIPVFFDVHTYGGHPVTAAAALANIQIIEREHLVENAATVGTYMIGLLTELRAHPIVGDVRGLGLFMAVELTHHQAADGDTGMRIDNLVAGVAHEMGVFLRPLGGTILLAPPLIFTEEQATRTVEVLDAALTTVEAQVAPARATPAGTALR